MSLFDTPLAYLPGNATRIVAKAVGDLRGVTSASKSEGTTAETSSTNANEVGAKNTNVEERVSEKTEAEKKTKIPDVTKQKSTVTLLSTDMTTFFKRSTNHSGALPCTVPLKAWVSCSQILIKIITTVREVTNN